MGAKLLWLAVVLCCLLGVSAVGTKRSGEEIAVEPESKKARAEANGSAAATPAAVPVVPPCIAASLAWWLQAPFWDSIESLCYFAEDNPQLLDDETSKAASLAYLRAGQLQELGGLVMAREAKSTRWDPKAWSGTRSAESAPSVPKASWPSALPVPPARSGRSSSSSSRSDWNSYGGDDNTVQGKDLKDHKDTKKALEVDLQAAGASAPAATATAAAAHEDSERVSHGGASVAAEDQWDGQQESKFRPPDPILPAEEGIVAGNLLEAWKQKAWRKDWRDHGSLLRAVVALVRYGGRDRHFKKRIPMDITLSGASLQVWSSLNDISEELNVQASSLLAAIVEQDKNIKVTLLCEHHGAEPVPFSIWVGVGQQSARVGKGGWSTNDPWFSGSSGTHQIAKVEWLERIYNMFVLVLTSKTQFSEKTQGAELREFLGLPANTGDYEDGGRQGSGVWGSGSPVRDMASAKWTKVWNIFTPTGPTAATAGQPAAASGSTPAPQGESMAPAVLDSSLAADASAGQTPQPEAAPEGVSKATSREGVAEDQGLAQGPVSKEGKTKITVDNKDKGKDKSKHRSVQSDRKGKDHEHSKQRDRKDPKDKKEKDKGKDDHGQRTLVVQ